MKTSQVCLCLSKSIKQSAIKAGKKLLKDAYCAFGKVWITNQDFCNMQGVTFAIFGLGNKQYEHFCAVGKRVYDAMTALGATPVVDRGEGDDDEDIDADFDSWKEKLLAALDTNPALCKTAAPRKVSRTSFVVL